jgi:hypothetical protein
MSDPREHVEYLLRSHPFPTQTPQPRLNLHSVPTHHPSTAHSTQHSPTPLPPRHELKDMHRSVADVQLTLEAYNAWADFRRNYRFRPSSHENDLQSNNEPTIRPNITRAVLRPKSQKGVLHQFGVLQQHRIDRVLENEQLRITQFPCGEIWGEQQRQYSQTELGCFHKIDPPMPGPDSGLENSATSITDLLMDVLDYPKRPRNTDLPASARQLVLPGNHAGCVSERGESGRGSIESSLGPADEPLISGTEGGPVVENPAPLF